MSTPTQPVVRIGFIGCGGIAQWHVQRLAKVPEAKIVALCDPSAASIQRMVDRFPGLASVPQFTDYHALLRSGIAMDGVQLHTPHTQHFQQATDSMEAGLHVLSEKPMVCTVADAHQLIKTIERTGKTFGISYQRHSEPGWRWIKQQIDTGAVGTVEYVAVFLTQGWLQGTRGTWRQNLALSGGGQLNDSGSHMLDVMLWITGLEADVVSATTENFDAEVDINTGAWVKFTNGARGTITVIGNAPVWWEDVTIVGSKGSVYLRQGRLFWAPNGAERPEEVAKEALPAGSDPDKNWVEAIAYGKPIDAPATCGLRVIELTEAAWKSAASGKPVKVVRG